MLTDIPALSIRQPWASLIIHAGKDVENRSWPTRFRGLVLIHAAKGLTKDEREDCEDEVADGNIPDFPLGGIIGAAEIVDCVTTSSSSWFNGPYGFVLRNVRPLPFVPCRGSLGFFKPPLDDAGRAALAAHPPAACNHGE